MSQISRKSFAVCAMLALAMTANSLVAQSKESISTKYISKDAFLVIAIHPSKIASCADQKSETTKYVLDSIKKFTGIEVKKLENITLQLCAGKDIKNEGDAAIVTMHFSEDVDDSFARKMGEQFDFEKAEKNGKPLYKPERDDKPCLYFPDKKTIVMCVEKRLKSALAGGKHKASKIATKIKTSDHIGIAFDLTNEEQKESLEEMLENLPVDEMGFETEMLKKVKTGEIHIDLKSDTPMSATMVCKDSKTATAMVDAGTEALEGMTENLEQAEASLEQAPPGMAEAAEGILEIAFKAVENTKFVADGSKVTVRTNVKGGMTKAVDNVAKMAQEMIKMIEMFGGGG